MAEFKRQTFQLSTGKQIKLHGNSFFISKSLEIGEGFVPNIFFLFEEQAVNSVDSDPVVPGDVDPTLFVGKEQ